MEVTVLEETTKHPLQLMGFCAGTCYGVKNLSDKTKNKNRALDCLESGHGRVLEYPQVYLVIDGCSAKVIRELYTHIGGAPTRLQASTRYISYENFEYVLPPSIKTVEDKTLYIQTMDTIAKAYQGLVEKGIAKEDASMLLPFGMTTKIVLRTNLRQLLDMAQTRLCTRAFWEFRKLMRDIGDALSDYSTEWRDLVKDYFKPKCEILGYCPEKNSCGKYQKSSRLSIEQASAALTEAFSHFNKILQEDKEHLGKS
jgi:thymidylate synthase (FAD)